MAVTRGCYRSFDRVQLRAAISGSPIIFDRILSSYNAEKNRGDQLVADLGRRSAAERVARLILDIWQRLEKAGMIEGNCIEFPLRQTHIADATGLTPAYVNKVLGEFRSAGLVGNLRLTVIDMRKLRQLTV